jgi:hypothetical protein
VDEMKIAIRVSSAGTPFLGGTVMKLKATVKIGEQPIHWYVAMHCSSALGLKQYMKAR